LHHLGRVASLRFTEGQMNVLRHHYIAN
jgi:hypothetical protein